MSGLGKLTQVPISEIKENPVALRTVNRESEDYLGLVESIRQKGFMGAIVVRPKTDSETGQTYYELVDGLHRFNAAKDAGLTEINAEILDLTDDQTLEAQIMANIHKIETKPVEYSQQLRRILASNPLMTEAELAQRLGKSTQWIKERLGLTKIQNEEIQALVNEGKIGLANAYALAKLPPEEQADWVDRAMTKPPDEFVPAANARIKEIKEAKRQGKDAEQAGFQPVAFLQKMKDVKTEMDNGKIGAALIKQTGAKSAQDGWNLAIQWVLHLDPQGIEDQKRRDEERKKERDEAKKQRDAKKAAEKAEKLKKESEEAAAAAEAAKEALTAS